MDAIFLGRATLDLSYVVGTFPIENEKMFADKLIVQPGGPALNAAITFSLLGGKAVVISCFGNKEAGSIVKAQAINQYGLQVLDLTDKLPYDFPISTVIINPANSTRTVINNPKPVSVMHVDFVASDICGVPEIVLIDGYNLKDNLKVVADWKRNGAIIVMDGGSWKDNSWDALQLVDIAICSNRFRIPNLGKGQTTHELHRMGVDMVAITHEGDPIEISMKGRSKTITVPHVNAVDTLGAGDVLHGAFCYYYKNNMDFQKSIELAAVDASKSCKYFGTHVWVGK